MHIIMPASLGGDLSSWITAAATLALVFVNYRYIRLVNTQSETMTNQSGTMMVQAKIMQENMRRDQINRKYEKLVREMENLIGPLYSKIDDPTALLNVVSHSQEFAPRFQEMFTFWRDIKKNTYLAPKELKDSLNDYLDLRQRYRFEKIHHSTSLEEIATKYNKSFEDLKPKIKDRYNVLSNQIQECENALG